jgi:hypothetical protein
MMFYKRLYNKRYRVVIPVDDRFEACEDTANVPQSLQIS